MEKALLFFVLSVMFVSPCFAQVNVDGLGFSYSALVRDAAGRVQPSKAVKLQFTLLLGQNGTKTNSPWIETQNVTTDAYGFVNVTIGNGTKAGGTAATFAGVDFTITNYWIIIEVFNTFTKVYDALAKQALLAVPYAKVAGSVAGNAVVPAGSIVAFGGEASKIPKGWLLCDGRELDNTDPNYKALFNAIGYSWGTSNHSSKFNIPYTIGMFLRGAHDEGYNPNKADPHRDSRVPVSPGGNAGALVGSYQADSIISHSHQMGANRGIIHDYAPDGKLIFDNLENQPLHNHNAYPRTFANDYDYNKYYDGNPGNNIYYPILETRPKNVYVNYIIKL